MKNRTKTSPGVVLPGVLAIGSITGFVAIAIISAIANTNTNNASTLTYSSDTDLSFTFNPTLSISLSDTNINIDNLLPGLSSESSPITVSVNSNTPYGYSLFASVGNSTDYNTTSLTHEDSNIGNNAVFTSIATNASLPELNTDNTWGYTYRTHNTNNTDNEGWSNYNGLPLYSTVDNNTSTNNPALLIDTKNPADSTESIDFKIAAKASSTQASGTYNNIINFYAVGEVKPLPLLYDEVAKMNKGTQTAADLQEFITAPTSTDYREDTSNSGVYEYASTTFGESSDANNNYKIYYYRGILEPRRDPGEEEEEEQIGSPNSAATYPNYVKLENDTCWRIVRTTGSGGIKMIYNSTWDAENGVCEGDSFTRLSFANPSGSRQYGNWYNNASLVGYTHNKSIIDKTFDIDVNTVFGNNSNYDINSTNSKIKDYIEDTWYADNMINYTNMLEPSAGYCNDRSSFSSSHLVADMVMPFVSSMSVSGQRIYFGSHERNRYSGSSLTLNCPRGNIDLYTTGSATDGNKQLKYPVALLTADEAVLAGTENGTYYRYLGNLSLNYWLLSPSRRDGASRMFLIDSSGVLTDTNFSISSELVVRPTISLKSSTGYISGSGTVTDPWVVPAQ